MSQVFEQSQEPRAKEGNDIAKGSQTQSKAVHLLLTLLRRFPPLTVTFTHMQGHEMLAVVLRSSRSPVGYSLIKVESFICFCVHDNHLPSGQLYLLNSYCVMY